MFKAAPKWPSIASVDVETAKKSGETPTRRSAICKDRLVTGPLDGIETVYDIVQFTARTHGTKKAFGWRDIVDTHVEEKQVKKVVDGKEVVETKKWSFYELSPYKYINYIEVKDAVENLAAGLIELGVRKEDVFNIYAETK